MEVRNLAGANRVSDETLGCIFAHLDSPGDRKAVSQVCQQWRRVDGNTRKHVSITNCYSVAPAALSRRFPNLQSLRIKGKPKASEYELLVPNWGGYARPWVAEVARGYSQRLQSLWFRRMHVTDADLTLLAQACSESLHTLKLHGCTGFSTSGIYDITAYCRGIKVLYLEGSGISPSERGGEWLHELALYNTTLEELNFQCYEFDAISVTDLEIIVENCRSLRSLKVSEIDILDMRDLLSKAHALTEHGTGCCASIGEACWTGGIELPRTIIALSGLYNLNEAGLPMLANLLPNLKKLDLKHTRLSSEGHIQILSHCVSLEELEARTGLGDDGLIMVSRTCRKLRRIRVESGDDGEGFLSPFGIMPIAQNCTELEYLVMYVVDINNATLRAFGENCPKLKDWRIVLLLTLRTVVDLPLDEGVRYLLKGCVKLTRFALYVRHGALTDRGMGYIGEYGGRLKWILLGCAGESDMGLLNLAIGCQSLERLEMRDCPVTENGLANAALKMDKSLKFMWVQGFQATDAGGKVLAMARRFWIVEISPGSPQFPGQLLAYCALAGPRTDCPPEVDLLSQFAPADVNWEL